MRKTRIGVRLGLALACGTAACAAPGDDGARRAEDVATSESEVRIGASPADEREGFVGTGWSAARQTLKQRCITSENLVRSTGQATSEFSLRRLSSRSDVEQSLAIEADVRTRFWKLQAHTTLNALKAMTSTELADSYAFSSQVQVDSLSLNPDDYRLTQTGQNAVRNGNWQDACGDEYVHQIKRGGRFFLVVRFDFATMDAKKEFRSTLEVNIDAPKIALQTAASIATKNNRLANRMALRVEAFQFGGKAVSLGEALGGASNEAATAFVSCSLTNLDACNTFVSKALSYALGTDERGGFPKQVQDTPGNLEYETSPWREIGYQAAPAIIGERLGRARDELGYKYQQIWDNRVRVDRILNGQYRLPTDQRGGLEEAARKLQEAERNVGAAIETCYDLVRFDAMGNPETPTVNACVDQVSALAVPEVDRNLFLSAGEHAIAARREELGANDGLGQPTASPPCNGAPAGEVVDFAPKTLTAGGGLVQHYQAGSIYWNPVLGPRIVRGTIRDKFACRAESLEELGYPSDDSHRTPDGTGNVTTFERGAMYQRDGASPFEVHEPLFKKYTRLGEQAGALGYPLTDVTTAPDGVGRYARFQNGWIYFHPSNPAEPADAGGGRAYAIFRDLGDKWQALGAERGTLGYPIQDQVVQLATSSVRTRNGFLVSTPTFGLHFTYGPIALTYAANSGPGGWLGVPTTDHTFAANGEYVAFEHGGVLWKSGLAARALQTDVFRYWRTFPFDFGYPRTEAIDVFDGGTETVFERGGIFMTPAGLFAVREPYYSTYTPSRDCLRLPTSWIKEKTENRGGHIPRRRRYVTYHYQEFQGGRVVDDPERGMKVECR
jgi:hypothetical protein